MGSHSQQGPSRAHAHAGKVNKIRPHNFERVASHTYRFRQWQDLYIYADAEMVTLVWMPPQLADAAQDDDAEWMVVWV